MQTMTVESRDIAHALYTLLRSLDRAPAAQHQRELRQRTEDLARRLRTALAAPLEAPDGTSATLAQRLAEVARPVEEFRQQLSRDATQPSAFAAFRARAAPVYEGLAASLRAAKVHAPSLRPTNYARNAMHIASALAGVLSIELLPRWGEVVAVASCLLVFAWTLEFLRRRSAAWNRFALRMFRHVAHPHEEHRVNSATWYVTALFILALTCSPLACALACIVLGFGDPAAALVGRRWGRVRLRAGRSLEGTVAFVVAGTLASLIVLGLFHATLGAGPRLVVALVVGCVGALAELLSGTVDDNLSIPLAVGLAAMLTTGALGLG